MKWVAGADGCKRGWVVVLREVGTGEIQVREAANIGDVLRLRPAPKILCVDIPIGLLDKAVPGGRECDAAARELLGQLRATSVFSPPARPTLKATRFKEAVRINRSTSPHKLGIGRQTFGMFPKLREVEQFISRSRENRVVEVHPEVSFYELNGCKPIAEPKKEAAGRAQRIRLLEKVWRRKLSAFIEGPRPSWIGRDDIIDAMAACWTAERVLKGNAIPIPPDPPRDSRGLRMQIFR